MTTANIDQNHIFNFNIKLKLGNEDAKIYKENHCELEKDAKLIILEKIEKARKKQKAQAMAKLFRETTEEARRNGLTKEDLDAVIAEVS